MHPPVSGAVAAVDAAVPATSTCCGSAVDFRYLGKFTAQPIMAGLFFYCGTLFPASGVCCDLAGLGLTLAQLGTIPRP
jgi:hypothetical protein